MSTPVFEQAFSEWQDAIRSAEARADIKHLQFKQEILELLKTFKRPTVQVKEMIAKLENDN